MLIDSRSIPQDEEHLYDICIIGAGTAGLALARQMLTSNLRLCLIESGDIKPDKQAQSLSRGQNIGKPYFSLETARTRCFGGSTNRWDIPLPDNTLGLRLRPLDELDFEVREGVPHSGWPFPKQELDPYYESAQAFFGITPPSYEPDEWANASGTDVVGFDDDAVQTVLFKFASKDAILRNHAKDIRDSSDVKVYLNANVTDILTDEYGKNVEKLKVECIEGQRFWIRSKIFVLAAGGIETPRVLLMSNSVHNCGVGNENDLVGRFFMEHLHFRSGLFIPENPVLLNRFPFYLKIQHEKGVSHIGKYALSEQVMRDEKLLNCSFQLLPRTFLEKDLPPEPFKRADSDAIRSFKALRSGIRGKGLPGNISSHLLNIAKGLNDVAAATIHRQKVRLRKKFSKNRVHLIQLAHMTEQVPNPDSRVLLSEETDIFGKQRLNLDWQWTDFDIESNIRSQEIFKRTIQKSGMGDLTIVLDKDTLRPQQIRGGWHHMGTTRMHVDPQKGVVDENSRVHGLSNLYIAGPSVFPTGGQANPVLTIVALAIRLADHLSTTIKG